ncbi:hypothetical protein BGZ52_009434 [Haplosporangium bisporale]|nr:hypothetical protein BGZ52_009434 [Haplosporangium bisporale]KAI9237906.1 MAG: hypothetical protein BYD32DRAFT_461167 [Podila humilis]KFH67581.1 hypothetical protein MVEG_06313 [Podila verticillata NRRL 6337]
MILVSDCTYSNAAAVDPDIGEVDAPNGTIQKVTTGYEVTYMLEYDVTTEASRVLSQSSARNLSTLQDCVVVWSKSLNKLLVYGGKSNATTFNLSLYAYTPSADQWQVLKSTGSSPGGRAYFCIVPDYDGCTPPADFVLYRSHAIKCWL